MLELGSENTIIVFDAVGTVIKPLSGVLPIYHEVGERFGSQLSLQQVGERFREGRSSIFRNSKDFVSSDEIERKLWSNLVEFVFDDVKDTNDLFESLWLRFAEPDSWAKYDDVDECLASLHKAGIKIVIGSNFDSRLLTICDQLFEANVFDKVFCSSQVGYRKPASEFYQHIASSYLDHRIIMVGDDTKNDYQAPKQFGWEAFLINRKLPSNSMDAVDNLCELVKRIP